jgi:hypothetical protein
VTQLPRCDAVGNGVWKVEGGALHGSDVRADSDRSSFFRNATARPDVASLMLAGERQGPRLRRRPNGHRRRSSGSGSD